MQPTTFYDYVIILIRLTLSKHTSMLKLPRSSNNICIFPLFFTHAINREILLDDSGRQFSPFSLAQKIKINHLVHSIYTCTRYQFMPESRINFTSKIANRNRQTNVH